MDTVSELKSLALVLEKLPAPIPLKLCGRPVCPWCGSEHDTISFGLSNACQECGRPFFFGYPDWADEEDCPLSWVALSWSERQLAMRVPHLLPQWRPNERLKGLRHREAVYSTGTEGRA
jgi:hypothetical protein